MSMKGTLKNVREPSPNSKSNHKNSVEREEQGLSVEEDQSKVRKFKALLNFGSSMVMSISPY